MFDIKKFVHAGDNIIAVGVKNDGGEGGLNPDVSVDIVGQTAAAPGRAACSTAWRRSSCSPRAMQGNPTDRQRRGSSRDGRRADAAVHAASLRAVTDKLDKKALKLLKRTR